MAGKWTDLLTLTVPAGSLVIKSDTMMRTHYPLLILLFVCSTLHVLAKDLEPLPAARAVKANPEWERIAADWSCPEWYKDAKYGLWLHWGPQSVPLKGGGWYARHMYLQYHNDSWGKGAWEYHRATYGHQSQFGFKDICHLWKAEKFNTEATVVRMKNWGARME